jgi:phosphorylcholine metabolism protein LicD
LKYIEMKQAEFTRLLSEVDHICRENDIEYWIDWGTLLGCLRHEGFIPWDDDCDITMTRSNFEKFLKVYKNYYNGERLVQCHETNPDYPTVFGRYMDINTAEITGNRSWDMGPSGICMDVFFAIPVPPKEPERSRMLKWYLVYDEYINNIYRHCGQRPEEFHGAYRKCWLAGKIFGEERVIKWLEKQIYCCSDEECEDYIQASAGRRWHHFYKKEWIEHTVRKMNDGIEVSVPEKYLEVMRNAYTDGWRYLPEEQEENGYISNLHVPSMAYSDDYMNFLDRDEMLKTRKKRADFLVRKDLKKREKQLKAVNSAQIMKEQARLRKATEGVDIRKLIAEKHYAQLVEIFAPYCSLQLTKSLKQWPDQVIEVSDDQALGALYALIEGKFQYYKAAELIQVWENGGRELTREMRKVKQWVGLISDMNLHIDYGHWDKAEELVKIGLEEWPDTHDFSLGALRVAVNNADDAEALEAAEGEARKLLQKYPQDGEIEKCLGDVYWARGDKDKANEIYDEALEHTLNGLVHLDIKHKREDGKDERDTEERI